MQNLLSKKIEILKQLANEEENYELSIYDIVLENQDNLIDCTEDRIYGVETEICTRASRESNQDFYTKLEKINKEIGKYKLYGKPY